MQKFKDELRKGIFKDDWEDDDLVHYYEGLFYSFATRYGLSVDDIMKMHFEEVGIYNKKILDLE